MLPEKDIPGAAERLAATLALENPVAAASYYSNELSGSTRAMNVRSKHWLDVLDQALEQHGPKSRMILWAHNTHVGDARGTDMGFASIGQLVRERYGSSNVALVGTAGGSGAVMAAPERGLAMKKIAVPEPRNDSLEALLTDASNDGPALFVFPEQRKGWLTSELAHRAIGAVYYPDRDDLFYVPTKLGLRYDALCWYPRTTPVNALHFDTAQRGELETLRIPD
jgi:erythromycin esterase-like protein